MKAEEVMEAVKGEIDRLLDNAEMDEILQDKELVRNLKAGLKNGEYSLV